MLGLAGALCCVAAGGALGSWLREQRASRWRMLCAWCDALAGMRLLLEQERPSLPELLSQSARYISEEEGAQQVAKRLVKTAEYLEREPLEGLKNAYLRACSTVKMPWEKPEEQNAIRMLFAQLGNGTASMREQAAAACLRRLRPLEERAKAEAAEGGKLCMQLGLFLGLMAGIALW